MARPTTTILFSRVARPSFAWAGGRRRPSPEPSITEPSGLHVVAQTQKLETPQKMRACQIDENRGNPAFADRKTPYRKKRLDQRT
jgi:hypothetical protein